MKIRYRILIWIVLALVLALPLTVWLARDWPRRQVQSALARALEAEVELDRLEILGRRIFVLHGLGVRRMRAYPWLESLRVDRLTVTGDPGEILDNRIESLALAGAALTIRESGEAPPDQETAPAVVGRLVVESGSLTVRGGGGESRLALAGEVTGLGRDLAGEVRLRAGRLPLVPLLGFAAGSEAVASLVDGSPLDLGHPVEGAEITLLLGRQGSAAQLRARASGGIPFREPGRDRLAFPDIELRLEPVPDQGWRFTAGAESAGFLSLSLEGGTGVDGGEARVERARLETGDPALLLFALGLASEGTAARGRAELTLERSSGTSFRCRARAAAEQLTLPEREPTAGSRGLLVLDGLCPLALDYEGTLEEQLSRGWLVAGRAALTSAAGGTLQADGSLQVGSGSESRVEAAWKWSGPDLPALRQLAAGFGIAFPERLQAGGTPRAAGRVRRTVDRPVVSGTARVERFDLCLDPADEPAGTVRLGSGTLATAFRFDAPRGLDLTGLALGGELTAGLLDPLPVSLSGSLHLDMDSGAGRFDELALSIGSLARAAGQGRWDPGADQRLTAVIRLEEADLPSIRQALVPLVGELLPEYDLQAAVSGDFEATLAADRSWSAGGTLVNGEALIASLDGARVIQGLAADWQVEVSGSADGSLRGEASTSAAGFQMLWGSLFGDYSDLGPRIRLAGGLGGGEADAGRWWGEADLRPTAGVRLQGSLSGGEGPERRFTAGIVIDDLSAAFERCCRRPLGDSLPLLERFDAGGGVNAFAGGLAGGNGGALLGRVRIHGLNLAGAEGTMAVRGLELDLPLDLAWGPPGDGPRLDGPPRRGRMGFEELRLDAFGFQRTDTGLVVLGDTVSFEASPSIPLLGGAVDFHRLTLAALLGEGRQLEAGLTIAGLQLAQLSRAMEWPPFEGELAGSLPRVVLTPTRLRVEGGGEISLFGGTVSISDISGEEVLSRYPRLAFSADFREIDLARLTRTFDFGEVNGILEGRISDCRLFAGTPVGFEAEMRTVPRKGVPQTINVKAINNIAILGTGGRINVFDRGIHSLLDRYTYEQLGVRMRLEKDVFNLRGTENRGGQELFLKGRLPFRIDVVNAEPGKTVSFSTMLARLQALDFSQATTDTGGGKGSKKR